MACLDFPASPTLGQNYSFYHWDGSAWVVGTITPPCGKGIYDGGDFDGGTTTIGSLFSILDGGNADTGTGIPSCAGIVDGGNADTGIAYDDPGETATVADIEYLQSQIDVLQAAEYVYAGDPINQLQGIAIDDAPISYGLVVVDTDSGEIKVIQPTSGAEDEPDPQPMKYIVFDPNTQQVQLVDVPEA